MAVCPSCGAPVHDPAARSCTFCGTTLPEANAEASSGAVLSPPPPPAPLPPPLARAMAVAKKKGNNWLHIVGILVALALGIPITISIILGVVASFKDPASKPAIAAKQPTEEELTKAHRAGLSVEFAAAAWLTHRYIGNTYARVLTMATDEDITPLPSDEAIRDGLKATKNSIHNASNQLAFNRMYALLWTDHTTPSWKLGEARNPVYEQHSAVGAHCTSAVQYSFGEDPGMIKGLKNCLAEQRKLEAEEGNGGWDDL